MSAISCPHCGVSNEGGATFCGRCGKALPRADAQGPRIVEGQAQAATTAGQALQSDALRKELRKATGALLVVAILQCVFGVILLVAGGFLHRESGVEAFPVFMYASVFVVGLLFFGLYLWARRNPLPAAICGLVLFVTVHLLDALSDPTALVRGIVVKILIVLVLIRAISAGVRYRKLQQEMALS